MKVNEFLNSPKITGTLSGTMIVDSVVNCPVWEWNSGTLVYESAVSGIDLKVDGRFPEVLLGPDFTVSAGKVLDICCGQKQGAVGWDHEANPVLTVASGGTLRLRAYNGGMSRIEVFRSGFWDEEAPTSVGNIMLEAGAILEVDTTGMAVGTHDFQWPGVTIADNGAIKPTNASIVGGQLRVVVS
ncbi:hypothetical protein [Paracoccus beibuensis]|uniref:hypothetical protein n=1 Tax=Paracoccus beibuensis TaxID=547602 RepID=UPI00223ED9F4|nr:hypothetical protein [Paracoccus beibuensis]